MIVLMMMMMMRMMMVMIMITMIMFMLGNSYTHATKIMWVEVGMMIVFALKMKMLFQGILVHILNPRN